jgi:phenol hydroxylase P4 protein
MPFGKILSDILPTYYGAHPDFAKVDWTKTRWMLDDEDFVPAAEKSLQENGIGHKSCLRFWTPGLNGIQRS